ncbi:MAG: hypothetical protein D6689_02930 [Deltaproteobacteria bacterium]|nr:MAG: hypothetical protein D6689_02930 [Deltaproteobacteria bacterium]
MTRLAAVCAVAAAAAACDGARDRQCVIPPGVDVAWTSEIGCPADYDQLWDGRDDALFANTRTVNWLIDREDGDRLYFIDSTRYRLHYDFAARYLDGDGHTPVGTLGEFQLNYRRPNRRFVLGKLVHYLDAGYVTLEFSAGDTAGADMIAGAFRRVASAIYDGDVLAFRPVSARHVELAPELARRIPVVTSDEVFAGQVYQPLNRKTGYGTLRFVRLAQLASRPPLPTDIVVIDRVPNDISMVSGIITAEFQTPLAHVNILSKNRGTPNMALRDAFDDPRLRALEGRLVRLDVGAQEFAIEPADREAAQQFWDALRPAEPLVPRYDLSAAGPQPLEDRTADDAIAIGAKAANLAELMRVAGGVPLPPRPFAIPFSDYDAHLARAGVWADVDALLADAPSLAPDELQRRLFAIRWAIFSAPVDPSLHDALVAAIRDRWGDDVKVRFRSSTNAEDLAEFTGAGLYTSASGRLADPDSIDAALKTVWASAWSYPAFVERDFYRVDHRAVRMGVLVHPAFVGEAANGVAVTINEFQARRPAYYINAQIGDISVTNPTGMATPEQLLYYTWFDTPEWEVISRSSIAGGPVLAESDLVALAGALERIHQHFRGRLGGGLDFAMDVEFKLGPDRELVVKQARPLVRR